MPPARTPDSGPNPRVSVVVPVRDPDPAQFARAVGSVLEQRSSDFELVLLETPGERALADQLPDDARIRHEVVQPGTTLAAKRNRGFELARGEYIALFDADDVCEPGRLEAQSRYLDRHDDVDVLGSAVAIIDEEDRHVGRRSYPLEHDRIVRAMRLYNPLAQPSVMLRRAVIDRHGGYVQRDDSVCEDFELWSRWARAGVRFANLPDALIRYRVHHNAMKRRRLKASIRDTLHIKRTYWSDAMDLRARLRMWGERVLMRLPPRLVFAVFRRMHYHSPAPSR